MKYSNIKRYASIEEGLPQSDVSTDEWKGEGSYLRLINDAGEGEAAEFINDLAGVIIRGTDRKNRPGKPFKRALGALVADLLRIEASSSLSYGYHGMSPEAFRLLQVGYRPFSDVVDGMVEFGYVAKKGGFKEHTGKGAKAEATKFKATGKLLVHAASYGIVPAEWKSHFPRLPRPAAIPHPIVLKAESSYYGKGKRMAVDKGLSAVQRLAAQVNDINAFLHQQVIEPDNHYAFHRIFAHGDRKAYGWDQGGRLYSMGEDNYQQMKEVERKLITINGKATIELDIKASYLTILHALADIPLPNHPDPYIIPGFPRPVIKSFVTMTLGYDKFHADWSDATVKTFAKKNDGADLRQYAFRDVKAAVLRELPLLQNWPESKVRWGDLQFIESEAVIEAVHTLAVKHGVVALPVHDSIIVPASAQALATSLLSTSFMKHVGAKPTLEAKS